MRIRWKVVLPAILTLASIIGIFCTRNPIGDRILAKACVLGLSKVGECQLAK